MPEKLASVNEQLDELLVKHLELIQDYISITVECESHQKTGFLQLAKARYIQGSNTVSRSCLFSEESEEEREAILTVTRQIARLELERLSSGEDSNEDTPISYEQPTLQVNSDGALESQLNKQFGVLSSGTLKSAKGEFRKTLEKTLERVSIVEQMLAVRERYKGLMKKKLELESSIAAP